jgi:hypothetical protein
MIPLAGLVKGGIADIASFHAGLSGDSQYDIVGNSRVSSAVIPGPFEIEVFGYPLQTADSVTTMAGPVPNKPTGLTASDLTYTDKVQLSWTAGGGQTSYKVYRHTSNDFSAASELTTGETMTAYSDTTAVAGTTYNYWVVGTNATGDSIPSLTDTGTRSTATPSGGPGRGAYSRGYGAAYSAGY